MKVYSGGLGSYALLAMLMAMLQVMILTLVYIHLNVCIELWFIQFVRLELDGLFLGGNLKINKSSVWDLAIRNFQYGV